MISFEYYFPYVRSSSVMNQERIYIEKHGDKESFAGVCEDYNLGMTLIFFLTNVSDYANTKWMNYSNHLINKAYMSGLSTNGKIILDIEQLPPSTKEHNHSSANRNKLIEAARQGDRTAMESNIQMKLCCRYPFHQQVKCQSLLQSLWSVGQDVCLHQQL